jgi:starch phosphorylase
MAHDTPIPGFGTPNTINLRLWSSESSHGFDLGSFNEGNYYQAISKRQFSETISSVRQEMVIYLTFEGIVPK